MENEIYADLLNTDGQNHLSKAGFWARIIGICGIILSAILGLMALFFIMGFSSMTKLLSWPEGGEMMGGPMIFIMGFIYLIMAGIYFFVSYAALQFGKKAREALATNSSQSMTSSLKNLNLFFTISGILVLISLGMALIGFLMVGIVSFFN